MFEEWDSQALRLDRRSKRHEERISSIIIKNELVLSTSRDGIVLMSASSSDDGVDQVGQGCPGSFAGAAFVSCGGLQALALSKSTTPDELQLISLPSRTPQPLEVPGGPLLLDRGEGAAQGAGRFKQLPAGTVMALASYNVDAGTCLLASVYESGILAVHTLTAQQAQPIKALPKLPPALSNTTPPGTGKWGEAVPLDTMLAMFPSLGDSAAVGGCSLQFPIETPPVGRQPAASPVTAALRDTGHETFAGSQAQSTVFPQSGATLHASVPSSIGVFSSACTCVALTQHRDDVLALCGGVSRELALVKLTHKGAQSPLLTLRPATSQEPPPCSMHLQQHITLPAAGVAAVAWGSEHQAVAACWDSSVRTFAMHGGQLLPTAVLAPACGRPTCATVLHLPAAWHSCTTDTLSLVKPSRSSLAAGAAHGTSGRLRAKWTAQGAANARQRGAPDATAGMAAGCDEVGDTSLLPRVLVGFDSGRCCLFAFPS